MLRTVARDQQTSREPQRPVERIVPWVASIGLHAGLVGLAFLITWTVVRQRDEKPVLIVADFDAMHYDPLEPMKAQAGEAEPLPDQTAAEPLDVELSSQLAALEAPTLSLHLDSAPPVTAADFAATAAHAAASFVGLTTTNARTVVYVIDASGSMIGSLPIVVDELSRSLASLSEQQSYGVIFFQRNDAVVVPPAGRLQPVTAEARQRTMRWIHEHVTAAGRSNPIGALKKALAWRPDVIFLLSEDITGSGEFEIDQRELLALLDRLNPADASTGRRATRINCIQFLDPDPLETLQKIAEQHGGADGYRLLGRRELGVEGR